MGPDASRAENAGAIGLAVVGAIVPPLLASERSGAVGRLALGVLGADLWGGAWATNAPSCVRWYERNGQGLAQHLRFAAVHLHPFVIACLTRNGGRAPWWIRGAVHCGSWQRPWRSLASEARSAASPVSSGPSAGWGSAGRSTGALRGSRPSFP